MSVPQMYHDLYDNDVYLQTRRKIAYFVGSEQRTIDIMNTLTDMALGLCRNPGTHIALAYLDLCDDTFAVWNCCNQYAAWWIREIAEYKAAQHEND